ncbi:MAG: formyltransferase [candidate division NC10 bacterium]|nr:formyltransferase [candidate division NC10 bacterium]
MRILILGYHNIGYVCLKELLERGEEVIAVVTHRDDPEEEVWFESVAELALAHNIPLYRPENVNSPSTVLTIRGLRPDILFSFYYRQLLGREILEIPRMGCINLNGSLLPKYRGRCPVNWVLIHGEEKTGVTMHYMVEEADSGDIIAQKEVAIDFEDTAYTLHQKLARAALDLFRETFPLIKEGKASRIPQDHSQASYYGARRPKDGEIDWTRSARDIYNLVRAVTHPYPGAFTFYQGKRLFIWSAQLEQGGSPEGGDPGTIRRIVEGEGFVVSTGSGGLLIKQAQLEGGGEMRGDELLNQFQIQVRSQLGNG